MGKVKRLYGSIVRRRFTASTLVEVLVSSIIFLVIFAVSLETIARLTSAGQGSGYRYAHVLTAVESARHNYSAGQFAEGEYEDVFEWGEMTTEVTKYEDYENVYRLNIKAAIKNDLKRFEYNFIFEKAE